MLPHASQTIATALLAGLMISSGVLQAQAQEQAAAEPNDLRVDRFRQHLEAPRRASTSLLSREFGPALLLPEMSTNAR